MGKYFPFFGFGPFGEISLWEPKTLLGGKGGGGQQGLRGVKNLGGQPPENLGGSPALVVGFPPRRWGGGRKCGGRGAFPHKESSRAGFSGHEEWFENPRERLTGGLYKMFGGGPFSFFFFAYSNTSWV